MYIYLTKTYLINVFNTICCMNQGLHFEETVAMACAASQTDIHHTALSILAPQEKIARVEVRGPCRPI